MLVGIKFVGIGDVGGKFVPLPGGRFVGKPGIKFVRAWPGRLVRNHGGRFVFSIGQFVCNGGITRFVWGKFVSPGGIELLKPGGKLVLTALVTPTAASELRNGRPDGKFVLEFLCS
jgi:hypothetical protein